MQTSVAQRLHLAFSSSLTRRLSCRWEQQRYTLDADFFSPVDVPEENGAAAEDDRFSRISLADVTSVKRCMDPSLPAGHAFWLGLVDRPTGLYFIAGALHVTKKTKATQM